MAAKKFYGVKRGRTTGIFTSWSDCKASVDGFAGAQYKGFAALAEALDYMGAAADSKDDKTEKLEDSTRLLAYVDGSYNHSLKKYAFGCIFILSDGRIYTEYGNGDSEAGLQQRNVTGEMLGAMFATKFAILNQFTKLEIRYDYQGIEKWVTGEWRAKNELTQKYASSMRQWGQDIEITFTKVAAHTNVLYNELADQMAKTGLRQGNGVPRVRRISEMEIYDGTDKTE